MVVLIVGASGAAGIRWRRSALVTLFIVAAAGVATNIALLRDNGDVYRVEAIQQRAILAGIEIAGPNANPSYAPDGGPQEITFALGPGRATGVYLAAANRYGSVGYPPAKVRELVEPFKQLTDQSLVGALGLALTPYEGDAPRQGCVDLGPGTADTPSLDLAPGQMLTLKSDRPATVKVGRFSDAPSVDVGTSQPGEVQALTVPADGIPDPWQGTSSTLARACVSG